MDQADALYEIARPTARVRRALCRRRHALSAKARRAQAAYMAAYAALQVGDFKSARQHAEAFLQAAQGSFAHARRAVCAGREFDPARRAGGRRCASTPSCSSDHPNHADAEQWHVRRALALSLDKKHDDVVRYLRPLVGSFAGPGLMAEAQFLLGSSLLELKQHAEARDAFQTSLNAQPKWRQADETLLGLSRAQRALGDLKAAKGSIARLLAEFPAEQDSRPRPFSAGRVSLRRGRIPGCRHASTAGLSKRRRNSPLVPHALFGLAWAQLSQQKRRRGG